MEIPNNMTYEKALEFLQTKSEPGSILELETITCLLAELGNPHLNRRFIHIAGTSGKGSTCAFLSSILLAAGYKTGLYSSPVVLNFNERIQVNGVNISNDALARLVSSIAGAAERIVSHGCRKPTFFELTTALAFLYFRERNCDITVLETGLGGRLDATNVIKTPLVSAITNIGLDHTDVLGDTIEQIAGEKAGIIKENGTVVLYTQSETVHKIISDSCRRNAASLKIAPVDKAVITRSSLDGLSFQYGCFSGLELAAAGSYQVKNAAMAVSIAKALMDKGLDINAASVKKGLKSTRWPGRFEVMQKNPVVIVDGAHNPQKTEALMESLKALFPLKKISFVVGILSDKDHIAVLNLAAPQAKRFYAISPPIDRAFDALDLASEIKSITNLPVSAHASVHSALDRALRDALPEDIICIFGSLYQVGEVFKYFGRT
jgi:dihydrofolate synthase/folylpolyglutamate synthase